MMTLMARLCTLCAVCSMMQMALGDAKGSDGISMIGGLLMLHLVISDAQQVCARLLAAESLQGIYAILIR